MMILLLNRENMPNTFHFGLKSYLMSRATKNNNHIINNWLSTTCLFDGYLIEVDYKGYKTPKPLDKSGFFPPLPLGQRDMSKVAILNI